MVLTIALVNVQNRTNIENFVTWSQENKISLLCLTEAPQNPQFTGGYDILHSPVSDRGAAVIVIDRQLNYKCPYVKRRHVVVKIVGTRLLINLWYIPPQQETAEEDELQALLEKPAKGVVHLGDLNARSKLFEDFESQRGRALVEAAHRGNFVPLNEPGVPTFRRHRSTDTSVIDWVLVSREIQQRTKLEVLPALFNTDHELLVLTLAYKGETIHDNAPTVIAPGPFLRKIEELTADDDTADWFVNLLAAVTHARKAKSKKRPDPPNDELRALRVQLNQLMKTIRANRGTSSHLWSTYRELSTLYKEREQLHRNRGRFEQIRRIDNRTLYSHCRQASGKTKRVTQVVHGDAILKGTDASRLLIDHFFPDQEPGCYELPNVLPDDDEPLTKVEIDVALAHFSGNTAPGKTGISFDLLKQWYSRKTNYFVKLLSNWYSMGIYPEELKESIVVALIKDKRVQATVNNIRPISISDSIARWYERIVDTRLTFYVESRQLLSPDQYGFRPGLSAEDAARRLQEIREANMNRLELIIQTDVKSAFDKVSHASIISALVKAELPGNMIRVIASFIRERRASMYMGEDWVSTVVRRGVPQGSCLGPHLYILTTNIMLNVLRDEMNRATSTKNELVAYADDVVLVTSGTRPNYVRNRGQSLVKTMSAELAKVGLTLADNKLKFMMRGYPSGSTINWNGEDRELSEFMTVLGITFSQDATFTQHIAQLENKANELIQQYKSLIYGGLSEDCRRQLARTIIEPKLSYGASVWHRKLSSKDKTALQRITRIVGKVATAAPFHAGKATVALMAKTLPFHLRCAKKADFAKLSSLGHEIDLPLTMRQRGHPSTWKVRTFGSTLETPAETSRIGADLFLFTDGSRFTDRFGTHVGAAVIAMRGAPDDILSAETVVSLKLSQYNSVIQAELVALKYACLEAEKCESGCKVAILSDSLSSLQAIKSPVPNFKLAVECQTVIDKNYEKGVLLSLHHVRAHVGIPGNERADEAAKRAAIYGDEANIPAALSAVRQRIDERYDAEYVKWFKKDPHGRTIRKFFTGPDDPMLKYASTYPSTMAFYSGHGWNLSSMRYGFQGAGSFCICGVEQTAAHVLVECSRYVADNIAVATQVGISLSDFLGPWDDLRKHQKFHAYIAARAPRLNTRLRDDNIAYIEARDLAMDLAKLAITLADENDEPDDTDEPYVIYHDNYVSHFDTQLGWHCD